MATVTTQAKQGGVPQMGVYSFTSDGSAQSITLGFKPSMVRVWNETDAIIWEWWKGMASTKVIKLISHADTQLTADANSQILDNGDGTITIGATAVGTSKAIKVIAMA